MATCASCGSDVTGKKFCQQCGTPVQATASPAINVCPHCNEEVKPGAAFCMHCGSALSSQTKVATAPSQPLTRTCPACQTAVPAANAFCTNCGSTMQVSATPPPMAAPASSFCTSCGHQNAPGVHFCAACGSPIGAATPMAQPQYGQPAQYPQYAPQPPQYDPSQYGQPGSAQYAPNTQYPQQQAYGQPQYQQGQQYPQPGYQQQPMILRCPTCMAMSPSGTPACPSCHTSLVGIVPTPAMMPNQGQQGGLGGMMQGNAGKYAMGAMGGAAAIIGGEMLMHELEGGFGGDRGYERRRDDDGLLGGLGNLANDIGL
jgi:hypothetical protein